MELLDRSFRIYRKNFFPFFLLALIVQLPLSVISSAILEPQAASFQAALAPINAQANAGTMSPEQAQAILGPLFSSMISFLFLAFVIAAVTLVIQLVIVNGTLTYVTSENHLGRESSLGGALRAIGARVQGILGGIISFYLAFLAGSIALTMLICGCGTGLLFIFAAGGSAQIAQVLTVCIIGLLFGILGYAYLAGGTMLMPVLTLERGNIGLSLGRAWMLGKSRIWAVIAVTAAVAIVNGIIVAGISALVARAFGSTTSQSVNLVTTLLVGLPAAVFAPILPIAYTEIYFDARVRLEALDVALKSVNVPEPAVKDVPAPAGGRFLASDDFLNIALFAVGGLVLFLIYYFLIMTAFGSQFGRLAG